MRLLLHTCCGPCLAGCLRALEGEGIEPVLFWYNPNIQPWTEYRARRDCLKTFAEDRGLRLIMIDEYGLRAFLRGLGGDFEDRERRCSYCYRLRLEKTAERAREEGFDRFGSTLLISPYQRHETIREIGEDLAVQYGLGFFYRDFRPFFREGQRYAREGGFYLQKYCGCVFSEEERYLS